MIWLIAAVLLTGYTIYRIRSARAAHARRDKAEAAAWRQFPNNEAHEASRWAAPRDEDGRP